MVPARLYAMFFVLLPTVAATSSVAAGGYYSGNDIYEKCGAGDTSFCYGYVSATSDALEFMGLNGKQYCVPDDVTLGQLKDVVYDYLRNHPATRQKNGVFLEALAFSFAWPCS